MSRPENDGSPEDAPPRPFSAPGMLLKLVLLPGLLVVVLVGLTLSWLTRPGGDVNRLVAGLAQGGRQRWPAAVNLAAVLHEDGNAALKQDPRLARQLIEILNSEIHIGGTAPDELLLRIYLCRLLGEFRIADPLPVLLLAAGTQRNEKEVDVRRAAIEAIAVLAFNVREAGTAELRDHAPLLPGLLAAAEDGPRPLREAAAFTLGVVGGPQAQARLETMLADAFPEVRYNAATALARHGNPRCLEVLPEMLDLDRLEAADDRQRALIVFNALQAARQLEAANPGLNLDELIRPVERLTRADLGAQIRVEAAKVLRQLQRP
jgi:hypothetical protein